MALYKTLCAIATKAGRAPKGAIVELTEDEAKAFGTDYVVKAEKGAKASDAVGANSDPEATQTLSGDPAESGDAASDDSQDDGEPSLEEMSGDELKAKAKEMGLAVSGSKADLIERITLAEQAAE